MRVINRTAITLAGAQPYLDWMRRRDDDFPPLEAANGARTPTLTVTPSRAYGAAILLPEFDDETEVLEWVEDNYEWLFESQLSAWTEDESAWPDGRDLKMFKEWFTVEIHTVVVDMGEDDIEGDEI